MLNALNGHLALPGGGMDYVRFGRGPRALALIPGSRLHMYEGLGHALYEEAPDFWARVAEFCR